MHRAALGYISGQNETPARVAEWEVRLEQTDGNWVGTITSADPREILQTPDLSGVFAASGPEFSPTELQPLPRRKRRRLQRQLRGDGRDRCFA